MAQCPTCGSNVSEQAEVCPDCGMDLKSAQSAQPSTPEKAPTDLSAPPSPPAPSIPSTASATASASSAAATTTPASTSSAAAAAPAKLTLKRGGVLTGESFQLGERLVLGRFDPDSGPVDVDLGPLPEASYISRQHAEVWCDASGQWFIKDLGSRNGTFVRASGESKFQRITGEQAINDKDEIALGNARFEFRIG